MNPKLFCKNWGFFFCVINSLLFCESLYSIWIINRKIRARHSRDTDFSKTIYYFAWYFSLSNFYWNRLSDIITNNFWKIFWTTWHSISTITRIVVFRTWYVVSSLNILWINAWGFQEINSLINTNSNETLCINYRLPFCFNCKVNSCNIWYCIWFTITRNIYCDNIFWCCSDCWKCFYLIDKLHSKIKSNNSHEKK